MKKSDALKERIQILERQLATVLLEENKELLYDDTKPYNGDNSIGCFNLFKANLILKQLAKDEICLLCHTVYGEWIFAMNPQRNRIIVSPYHREPLPFSTDVNKQEPINEDNALRLMMAAGTWYVLHGEIRKFAKEKLFS